MLIKILLLFDDTVLNNIKYAKPEASNEEIIEAAEMAMCTDFINKLKKNMRQKLEKMELSCQVVRNKDYQLLELF